MGLSITHSGFSIVKVKSIFSLNVHHAPVVFVVGLFFMATVTGCQSTEEQNRTQPTATTEESPSTPVVTMAGARSVRCVIVNRTASNLTLSASGLLSGVWHIAPREGEIVAADTSAHWITYGRSRSEQVHAYIRFQTAGGYVRLVWMLTPDGELHSRHMAPPTMRVRNIESMENNDRARRVVTLIVEE